MEIGYMPPSASAEKAVVNANAKVKTGLRIFL
jgi:hypothetical protein